MPKRLLAKRTEGLGVKSLTGLVVGSMIGAGVFNLIRNTADAAGPFATIIAWLITAIGMTFLILSFRNLNKKRPDLDAGIYSYAEAGFGKYVGFNSAWGYWISAWLGNISYAVLLFASLGYFFPKLFEDGQNWISVISMSVMLWGVHFLILRGVRTAGIVNGLVTAAKVIPLGVFLLALVLAFKLDIFNSGFWGSGLTSFDLSGVFEQAKSMMLVTVWVFIGIEGAVIFSGRAKKRSDVVKATFAGFALVLAMYALMTVLAFGVAKQPELAKLGDPAMAYLFESMVGKWGAVFVNIALIIAVFGGWLAWTMFAAELPYQAAKKKSFPALFAKENSVNAPVSALLVTNILIQLFFLTIPFTKGSVYNIGIALSTSMILIPYALTAFYQLKYSLQEESSVAGRKFNIFVGVMSSLYAIWLIYAAGVNFLLVTVFLYAPAALVYTYMQVKNREKVFKVYELVIVVIVTLLFIYALQQLLTGQLDETLGINIAGLLGK